MGWQDLADRPQCQEPTVPTVPTTSFGRERQALPDLHPPLPSRAVTRHRRLVLGLQERVLGAIVENAGKSAMGKKIKNRDSLSRMLLREAGTEATVDL